MNAPAQFLDGFQHPYQIIDLPVAKSFYKPRDPQSGKGNYGHTLLIAGSYGKMGAALMAAKACLASGAGLLTCHIPRCGYDIMQGSVPEAMVSADADEKIITELPDEASRYDVVGTGPGIGRDKRTTAMLVSLLKTRTKGLVLDADALNILSENKELLRMLPPDTVLTPHVKEFERVFGKYPGDFKRFEAAIEKAVQYHCIIVLKGHFTAVAFPDGSIHFNTSGNAGMAKGGSGDVLTGIVTGLLSQPYKTPEAVLLAVFIHGFAGDLAAARFSQEAMLPTDLITCLGETFLQLAENK